MIDSWRFISMDEDSGLLEDEVSAIVEPAPGRLVLGHNTGLTFVDGPRTRSRRFEVPGGSARDTSRVMDMAVGADGTVWVTANDLGLYRIGPDLSLVADSPTKPVVAVETDARGRLWVAGAHDLFVREAGRILSRRRLLREVWGFPDPDRIETRTVDMHVAKLRRKLDASGDALIETVRRCLKG